MKVLIAMPRLARKKSEFGIYHVIVRGINRQKIFIERLDCEKYLEILAKIKKGSSFELLGYCLMGNHIHLLIKVNSDDISHVMKRIGTSFAQWFNTKYDRTGHVFQDRFRSECVEDEAYLLTVIRYIHKNPVEAGLVVNPLDYKWSSCRVYCRGNDYLPGFTDTDFILNMFGDQKEEAMEQFEKFSEKPDSDRCLDDDVPVRLKDKELREKINELLSGKSISDLKKMSKNQIISILHQIKKIEGSSIRQISRITGIGYNIIYRA